MLRRLRRLWALSSPPPDGDTLESLKTEGVVEWGEHSYGSPMVLVWRSPVTGRVGGRVIVGKYCAIASGVQILTDGNHRLDWVSAYPFRNVWDMPGRDQDGYPPPHADVVIGNDVWIGQDAMLLPGAMIGDGAVIGARALVAGTVRPYAVATGVPAVERRRRFTDKQIDSLLAIAWWDWSSERVQEAVPHLSSSNIDGFIASHC